MDYDRRLHSKYLILYHIILVTKYRRRILNFLDLVPVFRKIEKNSNFILIEIGTDSDHVHLLIQSIPNISISQIIKRLKQESTIVCWKQHSEILRKFYWKKKILWSAEDKKLC
ncbi:IS200/IS605 family transposase [Patescibacteria group bacterium]|jgi:putative transposase|nr:IS200/IS605 family transposase [Patescibacteria group bacterium]